MRKLIGVTLAYDDGTQTFIDSRIINLMQETADAIEVIQRAKDTAKRLVELS